MSYQSMLGAFDNVPAGSSAGLKINLGADNDIVINPPTPVVTTGTSGANAAQTVSTPTTGPRRILFVVVAYSAAPTQAGVTVTLNSANGAGFDTVISTGSANARYTFYQPSGELILQDGDALDVTAPAGGVAITSSIAIYSQV